MQKLTLSIDDDVYAMLHQHVGRGNIGRFVCDAVRPYLLQAADNQTASAFGMLSHLSKVVTEDSIANAKRVYMVKRYASKQS
jgi:hypothetical protein